MRLRGSLAWTPQDQSGRDGWAGGTLCSEVFSTHGSRGSGWLPDSHSQSPLYLVQAWPVAFEVWILQHSIALPGAGCPLLQVQLIL